MESTKKRRPHGARRTKAEAPASWIKNSVLGASVSLLCAVLLLLLGSLLCYQTGDPISLTRWIGLGALYLSSAVGGFFAVRKNKGAVLPCAALCGGLITLFFWLLSFLFHILGASSFPLGLSLLLRALIPAASILGGLLGARLGIEKKRPRRRA